ncbi:MAG: hypothetical protein ISR90_02570 [Candidatus Marinimicrobia bacterium]|nr:hypothetical protein [Candidatus Neomarinimicrobiota bacterium]MBL7022924.1 hypothetical protein [Candidatus Neomarinimicrobiota bacterium]MBL7108742.1 hypothetical protein [Candidatus Neomarinimicrobiota bacterium]
MALRDKQGFHQGSFQDLMMHRIHEILLVASQYDAFILEEDGRLTEQILYEYVGMNLSYAPRVSQASTATRAMEMLENRKFDLVIVMLRISDMDPLTFGSRVKEQYSSMPIILLVFDDSELKQLPEIIPKSSIDTPFVWSGNASVLPAIIKLFEDRQNVRRDVRKGNVRTILLIEDSPRHYSVMLPLIYKEILFHTQNLTSKSLDNAQKLLYMRTRPKILLARSYEEAEKLYKRYRSNMLGIISDVEFVRENEKDSNAGVDFVRWVRRLDPSMPIMLQSTEKKHAIRAKEVRSHFLHKESTTLLQNLRAFIVNNFGFGDFVFRTPETQEIVAKASNLTALIRELKAVSEASLIYHASSNHFSNWLAAHGHFNLASVIGPMQVEDFENIRLMRDFLTKSLSQTLSKQQKGRIVEFYEDTYGLEVNFARISKGSLGGKARGLAFANKMIENSKISENFPEVNIRIPRVIVIGTEEFDKFMDTNDLWDKSMNIDDDQQIIELFLKSRLTRKLVQSLKKYLSEVHHPLAVRSSSLLEDSQYQPLAGMYSTFMLPNCTKDNKERLSQLCESVKRIYASTFSQDTKSMMKTSIQRLEEEKMGIIIQELVGQKHENRFYPTFSGVAQNYNYYPVSYMEREEGVAFIALGLGRTIVEGEKALRFSPKYPSLLPQFYSVKSTINNSQNSFYALELSCDTNPLRNGEMENLQKYSLATAEADKTLKYAASVVCAQDGIIRDSLSYQGTRVVTFAPILKWESFPLSDIINELLDISKVALGCPVEIEFAVNIFEDKNKKPEFCLVQIRPMVIESHLKDGKTTLTDKQNIVAKSCVTLGNGIIDNLKNIIFVKPEVFDESNTQKIADQISVFNQMLGLDNQYILVGPGRWGTADPWLGIPVLWKQISSAKVIVEIGLEDFNIDPSFGSHFFQNVTSLRIGYFTINRKNPDDFLDWDWLKEQPVEQETEFLKHIRLDYPLQVKIDGQTGNGVIIKPQPNKIEQMDEDESTGI